MSDNTVSIVTAFYDLGRGEWEGTKNGHPIAPYIKRDVDTYFERFERLAKLNNPIAVFTQSKFIERVKNIRPDAVVVDIDNIFESHNYLMSTISIAQNSRQFINFVSNPAAPEYWSAEYVAINLMKSMLVQYAVENKLLPGETFAWIDFGYVRDDTFCPPGMTWKFDTEDKINLFSNTYDLMSAPVFEIVRTGDVYIQGCHIVAPATAWATLKEYVSSSITTLTRCGLIDDDQTALLMAYRIDPRLFKINPGNPQDWFTIFKQYNHD